LRKKHGLSLGRIPSGFGVLRRKFYLVKRLPV
jgi:hypothetical protein